MKKIFLQTLISTFFISNLFISCTNKPEKVEDYSATVLGKWELKEAFRNSKKTETLDNTTFEFTDEGTLVTNFNLKGELESHPYQINGQKIDQQNPENTSYKIIEADSANLTLTTTLLNINFKLVLEKMIPEEAE